MVLTPAEPEINWNTLPASVKVIELTYWLLSVKVIAPALPESFSVNEPGNKASLYLALSKVIAKNRDWVTAPNVKLVFSSPITKSCHWPNTVEEGDLPSTAKLNTWLPLPKVLP